MQLFNAGVFTVGYANGFLRRVKYGDVEVIRMIYMALRDHNWNTFEHVIQHEEIEKFEKSFNIRYECFHEANGSRIFKWNVLVTGNEEGVITFGIEGEALTDVLKNRAGLCILHPIEGTAGGPCELIHTDGSCTEDSFPITISAENPFKDLKAFRWRCDGNWYMLNYEGDAFETEDQRNWCDASYKTFCTPLEIPFPVLLKAGDRVQQKVTFKPDAPLPVFSEQDSSIHIVAREELSSLPNIGIAASTGITERLSPECISALRELNLHHYRIEVKPFEKNWIDKFKADCASAAELDLPLEIALHIADARELKSFQETCNKISPDIRHIVLLSASGPATAQSLIDQTESLKAAFPSVLIGAGTDYNYRELNVNRFDSGSLDFVSYSIDPQEHATDDLTIIENMGGQAETVRSARELYPAINRVHVSSLTLRKRFNPAASTLTDKILSNEKKADPRQLTEFAAVFTLGSIKSLASARANSVTFYQTAGKQGIISMEGKRYPVFEVLQQILSNTKRKLRHTESSDPASADALLLTDGESAQLILVNYTSTGQLVVFEKNKYTLAPYEIKTVTADHR
jgi:hypothetical protein